MEEHKGLPVAGYQPQSNMKVSVVNEFKRTEERLLRVIDNMTNVGKLNDATSVLAIRDPLNPLYNKAYVIDENFADQRWLSIARTHFEQGFMALNRAIFQPSRINLPEDGDNGGPG